MNRKKYMFNECFSYDKNSKKKKKKILLEMINLEHAHNVLKINIVFNHFSTSISMKSNKYQKLINLSI